MAWPWGTGTVRTSRRVRTSSSCPYPPFERFRQTHPRAKEKHTEIGQPDRVSSERCGRHRSFARTDNETFVQIHLLQQDKSSQLRRGRGESCLEQDEQHRSRGKQGLPTARRTTSSALHFLVALAFFRLCCSSSLHFCRLRFALLNFRTHESERVYPILCCAMVDLLRYRPAARGAFPTGVPSPPLVVVAGEELKAWVVCRRTQRSIGQHFAANNSFW